MLHFNQRNWFRMSPDDAASETLPEPRNRKEFYLSLIAGHTPTKKQVLFSGYGKYERRQVPVGGIITYKNVLTVPVSNVDENTIVMLGDQMCTYVAAAASWMNTTHGFMVDSASEIWINVESEADASQKVVIYNSVEWIPPQPKTATEFYLAKMAGVEVAVHTEKVFEQEFAFGTEPDKKGFYTVTISNAYDINRVFPDASRLIAHIDGTDNHPFDAVIHDDGSVYVRTSDASYAGTTHTLELFYKTVIEDVPVKTRTEQYLKAIAANKDASDSKY